MGDVFSKYPQLARHDTLKRWIAEMIDLCNPSQVYLCNGSEEEYDFLAEDLVKKGTFVPLNPTLKPHSFYVRSDPSDVARVESATFICSSQKEDAGPTNQWKDPKEMKKILLSLFSGCMRGRTMYIIPFGLGAFSSSFSKIGMQITDSGYVACSMKIMTHMGNDALQALGTNRTFIPCLHSVGCPLLEGEKDVPWPCSSQKYIVHFPEEGTVWSYGSGYGGNALLGKKSVALRLASCMGRKEGWLAEHMLLIGVTSPSGEKKYMAAAFPSQCGKTNLALLHSAFPGWKIECLGDDISWLKIGKNGRLYAINPESGFFGVAPGSSYQVSPYIMQIISKDTIFTNVALTADRDVWWEGLTKTAPEGLFDWQGNVWDGKGVSTHPNARFTSPLVNCPILDEKASDPEGVPLSAIIFGGRRSSTIPLVRKAESWEQGVFFGACISSERTAAAEGVVGSLRHDPFAMLPFCGYNMGDYFQHWLDIGLAIDPDKRPGIFFVNWFRKDEENRFLWPGYGENIRVLKWIYEALDAKNMSISSPIGELPSLGSFDISGLSIRQEALFSIDPEEWRREALEIESYFAGFNGNLPEALKNELKKLKTAYG